MRISPVLLDDFIYEFLCIVNTVCVSVVFFEIRASPYVHGVLVYVSLGLCTNTKY
jgi:hypothetical protein